MAGHKSQIMNMSIEPLHQEKLRSLNHSELARILIKHWVFAAIAVGDNREFFEPPKQQMKKVHFGIALLEDERNAVEELSDGLGFNNKSEFFRLVCHWFFKSDANPSLEDVVKKYGKKVKAQMKKASEPKATRARKRL